MGGTLRSNKILVIDDEEGPRQSLRMILKDDYEVLTTDDVVKALEMIVKGDIDIVALDIKMPKVNGIELLHNIKKTSPDVEVFLITGFPSVSTAIEAIQYGAYDYVVKPFDRDAVLNVVRKGLNRRSQNMLEKEVLGDLRFLKWV